MVTTSLGNHGRALAWAAERAGVRATIVMPADAYPNKIQACRDHGAEVVLVRDHQWPKLVRVLEDGRASLDTNLVENAIRPFVVGRKN